MADDATIRNVMKDILGYKLDGEEVSAEQKQIDETREIEVTDDRLRMLIAKNPKSDITSESVLRYLNEHRQADAPVPVDDGLDVIADMLGSF